MSAEFLLMPDQAWESQRNPWEAETNQGCKLRALSWWVEVTGPQRAIQDPERGPRAWGLGPKKWASANENPAKAGAPERCFLCEEKDK